MVHFRANKCQLRLFKSVNNLLKNVIDYKSQGLKSELMSTENV